MKQKKPFKPNYIPKEKLNIFSDNDYFLYSKKFFNTLNIDFFKAKSINLTSNRSKLGAFNPDININGISNTKDILVDMNLNTNLEKVFLNKCFNLDKEEDENLDLKDEILSILKEKEDEKPVSKVTSFYMRKTTLISTLHNQLEKNVNFKTALPNSKSNSNMNLIKVNKVHNEENINLFKSADTSEFFKNPEVKQVYPILPFIELGNQTSCLLNFHEQDLLKYFNSSILNSYSKQETEIINSLGQNNVEKREKLMGLYSTTKNQKDTGFQIVNNVVAKPLNELDLFNTVLLFKSKTSDLVFYLPMISDYFASRRILQQTS